MFVIVKVRCKVVLRWAGGVLEKQAAIYLLQKNKRKKRKTWTEKLFVFSKN